jgi:phytoene dehydrogenase-like protein
MASLVAALCTALTRRGVDIQLGVKARWEESTHGLRAGRPGDEQPFDAVVVNADPHADRPLGTEPLALSGYVLLLEINRRLTLPHHLISFGDDYAREFSELFGGRVPSDPTVYFCHPAASDQTVAPAGKSGLFVMVNAPAMSEPLNEDGWDEHAKRLRERCLAVLKSVAPEVQDADVTVLGERTPLDLAARGAPGGSIYGFLPHGKFGPFRRPRIRSQVPGVFYAGGGTHPGGGVPLVMLSGRFAAELALQHVGGRP